MENSTSWYIKENIVTTQWDDFVLNAPGGNHLQTSQWAQVKELNGWAAHRIVIHHDEDVLAGAQILQRSFPPFGKIAYLTKGPLFSKQDYRLVEGLLLAIRNYYKKERLIILSLQPANGSTNIENTLMRMGFTSSRLELAPTASVVLDLSEDVEKIFRKATDSVRWSIRKSQREGITCRQAGENDLARFYELYRATSERQSFIPYTSEYLSRMWQVFEPKGAISLLFAEYMGRPVSGMILISHKDGVTLKYLGWSGEYTKLCPNHALLWFGIEWSKAKGYQFFDFEGVDRENARLVISGEPLPDEFKKSPDFFKFAYGGKLVIYPQAYDWIPNPLFRLVYQIAKPTMYDRTTSSRAVEWLRKRGSFVTK